MKDRCSYQLSCSAIAAMIFLVSCSFSGVDLPAVSTSAPEEFIIGVDSNYVPAMEEDGLSWTVDGKKIDLFEQFADQGVNYLRLRVWTKEEGESGRDYAARTARRAQKSGINPLPVFFLSEGWADLFKQPAPAAWKDLSLTERAEAVRDYCRTTAQYFQQNGIKTELYQIGNEIDYGICGVFADKGTDRDNPEWMAENIWTKAARLIRASQEGIRAVDPTARFVIQLARWWDPEFCRRFFETMIEENVRIDFLGLSYFPTSGLGSDRSLAGFEKIVERLSGELKKPILIMEYGYPSVSEFSGQFSMWNHPVPGYALSPEGQKEWLNDFLDLCRENENIAGAFYWSPEWYSSEIWSAFSLFNASGESQPGLEALSSYSQPETDGQDKEADRTDQALGKEQTQ